MENKQHVQLPNDMAQDGLTPKDQLIYLSIRRYMNDQSRKAYPSLETISSVSGASINTIRSTIKKLVEKGYFTIEIEGRKHIYHFSEHKGFEPFSYEFLDKKDISFTAKAYLAASQQYMYTDIKGYGKISKTNKDLSEMINMPESTISKCNRELERKQYLTIIKNCSVDSVSGCHTNTTLIELNKLGQAIVWGLKDHEERISQNTEEILNIKESVEDLKNKLDARDKLIDKLLRERENRTPQNFDM